MLHSFFWLSNTPLKDWPHVVYLSSADGHSSCFHHLAIVYSAVMNMCLHVFSTWTWALNFSYLGYMPWSRIAGSYDQSVIHFLRNPSIFYMSQKQHHCIPQITIKCNYWAIKWNGFYLLQQSFSSLGCFVDLKSSFFSFFSLLSMKVWIKPISSWNFLLINIPDLENTSKYKWPYSCGNLSAMGL